MDSEITQGQPTNDEILESVQPQAAAVPAESTFDPAGLGYKFRNETIFPKDRNEAIELLQLGHSYRVNKPKWDTERQAYSAFEARKDVYQRYDMLSQALQANPEFRTELEQLAQKYSGPKPQAQPKEPSAIPPEMVETLEGLKQWKETLETREADNELNRELESVQRDNASYDWKTDSGEGDLKKQLLNFMHKNRVYDPQIAFDAMMRKSDLQRVQFEAQKKAGEEAAKARKAGVVTPGTQGAPQAKPQGINHRAMSYDDLEKAALASIGR